MGSRTGKSDDSVSSMSSLLQRNNNLDFQAHIGAESDIPFLFMTTSDTSFSAGSGCGGPLNHIGDVLLNGSNKMNFSTEFSNIAMHLINDHNVTVKDDTFTLNNQLSSFPGSGVKMEKDFEPLTPDIPVSFDNGMRSSTNFSGFCGPDTDRSLMHANCDSVRSCQQTSVDGVGNSGSNGKLIIGDDISSIRGSSKPDTLQKVDDSHIMVNTSQPQSLPKLDGSFLSLGYADGTRVSSYGSYAYGEGSGCIGDRCLVPFGQPFYHGSLNSTLNTSSFSDLPNTVCGVSSQSNNVVCSVLLNNRNGVSEIPSSEFVGSPSTVLQRQHIGIHEFKFRENSRISGIDGRKDTRFAEMNSQACLITAGLSANNNLEPAGMSTLSSTSIVDRTNNQLATDQHLNFDMGANMVLPQLSFTSATDGGTGRSGPHGPSSEILQQDVRGIQTTENAIGSALIAGSIPPVSSGRDLSQTPKDQSLKRSLLHPSLGTRRVRPRTMHHLSVHPSTVPAAQTEGGSSDNLPDSMAFPNSFFLTNAVGSNKAMTLLPSFSQVPYIVQNVNACNNLGIAAAAFSSSSVPPPNASGSSCLPSSFPPFPHRGAHTLFATKKSLPASNGYANNSYPASISTKRPLVHMASAKSTAAAASSTIPDTSAASARIPVISSAAAKLVTVKPDMAAVARSAKLAALAKSARSLGFLAKNAPAPYIKWQGVYQKSLPSGIKCLLCKRDLSYEPEGPIAQTDPPVAILPCGHTFHDHCLEVITPVDQSKTPPCISCAIGEA